MDLMGQDLLADLSIGIHKGENRGDFGRQTKAVEFLTSAVKLES